MLGKGYPIKSPSTLSRIDTLVPQKRNLTPLPPMSSFNATTGALHNNERAIIQLLLKQPTFRPDRIEACRTWCSQVRAQMVSPRSRMTIGK